MRKLFKNLPLALMVMALSVGCGKENASGSSSGKSDNVISDGIGNAGQTYQSIEELRKKFDDKSMSDGLGGNPEIYHMGTYFGGASSYANGSIQVSGCINLILWKVGECDEDTTAPSSYLVQQMQNVLNQGRLIQVEGADASSVSIKRATDVNENAEFIYSDETFDRNNNHYKAMLAGSSSSSMYGYPSAYLAPAKITLKGGKVIDAVAVKNNNGYFVVTTNLPVAANPVAAFSNNKFGYLSNIGQDIVINKIVSEKMNIYIDFGRK